MPAHRIASSALSPPTRTPSSVVNEEATQPIDLIDALEGRLSLRWMETTRIIVLAMMVLFVGVVGLAIRLGG